MLRISVLEEDIPTIQRDRFYHTQPHIMVRMHILSLHHKGEFAQAEWSQTLQCPWRVPCDSRYDGHECDLY